ncbi:MAG: uroporphyrinogen-III C-methyltransferase [Ottowia sp.]|nr:uroporphyrinogen-III C-methyltransferase [Ottowia sp.]MBQ9578636.1 uroporphyrinogen-III C-methyltransferase [Ottowia sp.]
MSDLPTKDEAETPEAAPQAPESAAAAPESAPENAPETAPESTTPDVPEVPAPAAAPARAAAPRRGLSGVVAALALLLALGALGANFMLWQRLGAMQGQLARQSHETATRAEAAGNDSQQARDVAQSAAARMDAVETRVTDMAQWRAQLEELLRSAAHARDENMAVELEAALLAAQEQAQMTGNVQPMLAALRTAQRRLARNVDPALLPVARAVEQDLEHMHTAPAVDVAALLSRIERLHAQVDSWPASAELQQADKTDAAASEPADAAPLPEDAQWWERAAHAVGKRARALVRVSTLGQPQAGTLTVEQVFLLRERLRLHLQGARLALLGQRFDAARSDLGAAAGLVERWFSLNAPNVQAALNELRSLERQSQSVQQPPGARATLRALGEVEGTVSAADAVPILPPDDAASEAAPEEKEAPASGDEAAAQPAPEPAAESASEPEPAADAASAASADEGAAPAAEPAAEPASAPASPEAPASGDEAAAQPQQEASL